MSHMRKTPILKRGTAQRLRLPAESFQNAPHDDLDLDL